MGKPIAQMTEEEKTRALLLDDLTGLGSRRAWEDRDRLPVQAMLDVEGLKWINDNVGWRAGDDMLRVVAAAIAAESAGACRLGGDEFALQGESETAVAATIARIRGRLREATIEAIDPAGRRRRLREPRIHAGIGRSVEEASAALAAAKHAGIAIGERAVRGARPRGLASAVTPRASVGRRQPGLGARVAAAFRSLRRFLGRAEGPVYRFYLRALREADPAFGQERPSSASGMSLEWLVRDARRTSQRSLGRGISREIARWRGMGLLLACLASAAGAPVAAAEEARPQAVRKVVIGPQYRAKALHRWLWGADYRDLYSTPVELPVLDLRSFAGGLTPTGLLGHGQTQALGLKGADGRAYTFRPVIKDPTGHLPEDLRETLARRVLIDQMSSGHPAGPVVVPGILRAAGVLHNEPRLVVMPDDAALGEYRQTFANVVGDIEEWGGSPGFGGTTETIDGEEMWKRLRESPDVRVDSRAYLKGRLADQLMGDWDRHRNQYRWGKVPGQARWQPIPEDRDQAFARFEGVFNWFLRPQLPLVVRFRPEYSRVAGLTFDGWDVDKRILADLEWPVWEEVARELQGEVTDEVIDAAARLLPPEFFARDGARLAAALKSRRDGLPAQARRFYRYINKEVDVFGTDAHELVEARRLENGDVELSVRLASGEYQPLAEPYFHRRFEAKDTKEVRVYLYGGNDKVVVTGGRHGGVLLRVVAGDGVDVLNDVQGGGTRFSGLEAQAQVSKGPGTVWDRRPYPPPPPSKKAAWMPARDWGRVTGPFLNLSYGTDFGVLVGGSLNTTGYGFRKDPWSDKQSLKLLYSTKEKTFRGTYLGDFRLENSPFRLGVAALGSGIEISRFFGSGNETTLQADKDDYKLEQDRFQLEPSLIYGPHANFDVSLGLVARFDHSEPRDNPVLNGGTFYGQGDFTQLGLSTRLRFDGTDQRALPRKGVLVIGGGHFYPALADVEEAYGEVHGEARAYLSTRNEKAVTLALKGGGQKVFGTHPFFESAFIGGRTPVSFLDPGSGSSVRGLPPQRYAGDASAYGGADLYLPVTDAFLLVPGQLGVVGFFDIGRVFVDGETSDRWHHGAGGGIFFTTPARHSLFSVQFARSERNTAIYVRGGLIF